MCTPRVIHSVNRDIYLQSVTGQTPINLTADSAEDEDHPSFSPDGERIAFRSNRDGGGIFVMGRTGEAVRRVAPEGFNPAWSPDGTRIVYASIPQGLRPGNSEGFGELRVVSAAGGDSTLLCACDATLPHWSPNGHRIAFGQLLGAARQADVVTIPAEGGEPVAVTADSDVSWNPAALAPCRDTGRGRECCAAGTRKAPQVALPVCRGVPGGSEDMSHPSNSRPE